MLSPTNSVRRQCVIRTVKSVLMGCLISACGLGASNGMAPGSTVALKGQLVFQHGSASPVPISGAVALRMSPSLPATTLVLGVSGRFDVIVVPGRYLITSKSPRYMGGSGVCRARDRSTSGRTRTLPCELSVPHDHYGCI